MKCRRKAPGTTGVQIIRPHKMMLAGISKHTVMDEWPVVEATVINTHTDHPAVSRINDTHGLIRVLNGTPHLVKFGLSVVVDCPPDVDGRDEGQIVHEINDFFRCYEPM